MKTIAFYLPQFHPTAENNKWWGPGFTEWHNVSRAKALFRGHRQPRHPGELGYYDLRCADTRHEQAGLARAHGIDGFCYYHYWFHGKRLLHEPLDRMLEENGDFPFCLCWANEHWARTWDGKNHSLLMEQKYSESDHRAHIRWLIPILRDARYIRVRGRPLFLIYKVDDIPDFMRMKTIWQEELALAGQPDLYWCAVKGTRMKQPDSVLKNLAFEAVVDFHPADTCIPPRSPWGKGWRLVQRAWNRWARRHGFSEVNSILKVSYSAYREQALRSLPENPLLPHFPSVFPNWDNSPRKKEATIFQNDKPADFGLWVEKAGQWLNKRPADEQILFVNAWNEWAESAHLEPDQQMGRAFLEAFAAARKNVETDKPPVVG